MPATNVAATKKPPADAAPPQRSAPAIDPRNVQLQSGGHVYMSWVVRLPEGFIADDLKETRTIWRKVQSNAHRFRKFDRVFLIAFDESWCAEAVVADANTTEVQLSRPRVIDLAQRIVPLFEDETYRIRWTGNGYVVERKRDALRMTQVVATEAEAKMLLFRLYPRPA